MHYELADDLQDKMYQVVEKLRLDHVNLDRVRCIRSRGSRARGVIARVHGLPKAIQVAREEGAYYVIEFLERFERLSERDKIETIIHELLHIPQNFGGGFRHHDYVKAKTVKKLYEKFVAKGY